MTAALEHPGHTGDHSAWEALGAIAPSVDHDAELWRVCGPRTAALLDGRLAEVKQRVLATALFGVSVEGARRRVRLGGLSLQVGLVVLPAMLVAFTRGRDLLATVGMILASVATALQPDRAMAAVLVEALAVLAMYRRDRRAVSTLAVTIVGYGGSAIWATRSSCRSCPAEHDPPRSPGNA